MTIRELSSEKLASGTKTFDLKSVVINNSFTPESCLYDGSFLDLVSRNVFLSSLLILGHLDAIHSLCKMPTQSNGSGPFPEIKSMAIQLWFIFKGQEKTNRLILWNQALEFPFINPAMPSKRTFFLFSVKFHKHDREPWDLRFTLNKKLFLQL